MLTCTCCRVGVLPNVATPFVRMYLSIFVNDVSDCCWAELRVVAVDGIDVYVWIPIGKICPLSRIATP